jgi:hypothetical protein
MSSSLPLLISRAHGQILFTQVSPIVVFFFVQFCDVAEVVIINKMI